MPCDKWQQTIPSIKGEYMAIILWWVNICYPGAGTLASSCLGEPDWIMDQIIVGILQWLTACCFIGWIWSVWWGGLIYKKRS
mmetsp:Transcript_17399/g.20202  ORF Transcript_17399/g.20202 Transcript_17399/m.20202 type:complete len:82 (+) Transcript_17399:21-266(+)